MESKWYFFPGQTAETTKISDRAHALHISAPAWKHITQHLERKKKLQEAMDRERAHKIALKEGSEAMTKNWPNSIENLRLRKEKERLDRMGMKNVDKIQMFYKMRDEQEAIRQQYVEKVKKDVFVSSGYPKDLTSALVMSETLYERDRQLEFNQQLKRHQQELKDEFSRKVIAEGEKQKKEDQEKKLKQREEASRVAQSLRDQIKENEQTRKLNNATHIKKETEDRMNAEREVQLIKEYELEQKKKKRLEIAKQRKKALQMARERQMIFERENEEMDRAAEFYSEAKMRMNCKMKQKEKEMRDEHIRQLEELAVKVGVIKKEKDALAEARLAKVLAEAEEKEKAKEAAKAARLEEARQDRIQDRKQHLERMENENYVNNEVKRWELLNRLKTDDVMKEFDERNRQENEKKKIAYRKEILEQIAEDKEREKEEKEIDQIMSRVNYEDDDKMFFEYADEVLNLAKSKNRSTYPIDRVIADYKRVNKLVQKDRHCRCCKK